MNNSITVKNDEPLISTIIISDISADNAKPVSIWNQQTLKTSEVLICSAENLMETITNATGSFVHICNVHTLPSSPTTYETALKKMLNSSADIGCFGWTTPKDTAQKKQFSSCICGTGNCYTLIREVFKDNTNTNYGSYGGKLFNKIIKRELFLLISSFCHDYYTGLYDLLEEGLLVQIAQASEKVLFDDNPLFLQEKVLLYDELKTIHPPTLFQSIFYLLQDCERLDTHLLNLAALACLSYELDLSAQMKARKWYASEILFQDHITSFYSKLLPNENLLFLSMEERFHLHKIEKINLDRDWLKKQNLSLQNSNAVLQKQVTEQNNLLNKKLVKISLKIQLFLERMKKR